MTFYDEIDRNTGSIEIPRRENTAGAIIMRLLLLLACAVLTTLALGGTILSRTPDSIVGSVAVSTPTFPATPAFKLKGDSTKGKSVFASAGCGNCHTLAAANASGTIGPNLDSLKPDYRAVTAQVTNGGAQMPAFKSQLSTQQIADVSAYVVTSTGGTAP